MARFPQSLVVVMIALLGFLTPSHGIRTNPLRHEINAVAGIKPTLAGYLPVGTDGSAIYYAYYESHTRSDDKGEAPIILWLQGGPGCASTFGGFYELGPWSVTPDLQVEKNPGTWNRMFGLLLMDQPVGTGYSHASNGSSSIPVDEMGMAAHLYEALQGFFTQYHTMADRPLFITGESYAGKYVPSIAHFILQAQLHAEDEAVSRGTMTKPERVDRDVAAGAAATTQGGVVAFDVASKDAVETTVLSTRRALPHGTARPLFRLAGIAIGNGLTEPRAQTQTLAAAAYYGGLLPPALRDDVAAKAAGVVALLDECKWLEAHTAREQLRNFITKATGLGTLFDTRRTQEYDPTKAVDRFLDLPEVKEAMRANPAVHYSSCSSIVGEAMAADIMRSVKHLFPDLLKHLPVLMYQGQYDILDGVASVTSWLNSLEWPEKAAFNTHRGQLWYLGPTQPSRDRWPRNIIGSISVSATDSNTAGIMDAATTTIEAVDAATATTTAKDAGNRGSENEQVVAGWWRSAGRLTHVVVYRAGHMVPHDQPLAAQQMIEKWVLGALEGSS